MRGLVAFVAFAGALLASLSPADARLVINVDKSRQLMSIAVDGATRYQWRVSTGRAGFGTPSGVYRPQRLERTWFSRRYYNSPMPHSIFFSGGYAIHGSYEISRLGGPASHGCIRLHPGNAATLYSLVRSAGIADTTIVVSGSNPTGRPRPTPMQPRYEDDEDVPAMAPQPRYERPPYSPYYSPGGVFPWGRPGMY